MNKKLQAFATNQSFNDFVDRMTARWRLRTKPTHANDKSGQTPEEILRDIIAMPTTTGNKEALHDALDYIDTALSKRGMSVKRLAWNGTEALVATTRDTKTPTVYLAGHIDVVPGEPDMFELTTRDGKYFGRGVVDMKGAIAAYLSVIQALPGDIRDYDFGVMIMTDEEVGGFDGAANLAAEGYVPRIMVLPDGGGPGWHNMERFAKGIWHVTLEAAGKSAHGSRPWEGENAVDKLTDVLPQLKALFGTQNAETSTFNVGVIQGGEAINQIPSSASASIDMRFASLEEQRRLQAQVTAIAEANGLTITLEVEAEPMINDPDNPLLKAYAECTEAVTGRPVKWTVSNAGNDGRFFVKKGAVCAIAYPEGGNHHGPGEWMKQESYTQLQQIIRAYLEKVARTP